MAQQDDAPNGSNCSLHCFRACICTAVARSFQELVPEAPHAYMVVNVREPAGYLELENGRVWSAWCIYD
jgi:hypothetical protein